MTDVTTPIPTPVPIITPQPESINIVVLGSDQRPDWNDWHTDAVHVVSIQPLLPSVTVLSIPRDLYIYIPGFRMHRINFADMYGEIYHYEGGGPALMQQTLLYNLGISVDHYVRTDFDGFIGIVDAMGGVDIPVHCNLQDYWPYPDDQGNYYTMTLEPGLHHFDGETALWYARSRMTTSVFDREERQQQVLQALWGRSRSLDMLTHVPDLWNQYREMVITDMSLEDMIMLADVALRLDPQNVRFYNIGYQQVTPWVTPTGGYVFLPNWEEMGPLVEEAMSPMPEGRLWRTADTIEVWNGTWHEGWDALVADRLNRVGFATVTGTADHRTYPNTQIIDFSTTGKGNDTTYLQNMFNVWGDNVISMPDPNATASYRIIVGADYQPCY